MRATYATESRGASAPTASSSTTRIRILEGAQIKHYKTGAAKTLDNGGIVEARQERYGLYVFEMAGERYTVSFSGVDWNVTCLLDGGL